MVVFRVLTFPVLDMQIYVLFKKNKQTTLPILLFALVNSFALHSLSVTEDAFLCCYILFSFISMVFRKTHFRRLMRGPE